MKTNKMTQKDYYIAYDFLKIRATFGGCACFHKLDNCPKQQKEKIIRFLSRVHQVRFI